MKTINILPLLLLTVVSTLAQNAPATKNYLALELDPAPFILSGYSFSLKYSSPVLPHLALTASTYGSSFPDGMMTSQNRDAGFTQVTINQSYALFADYFLRSDRSGFYAGPSVFFYSKSVSLKDDRQTFRSVYPNLRVGYVYKPFSKYGFYLNPWLNAGQELFTNKGNQFKSANFSAQKLSYILALHVGYQVTF